MKTDVLFKFPFRELPKASLYEARIINLNHIGMRKSMLLP